MKKKNQLLLSFISSLALSAPLFSAAQEIPAAEAHVHDENCAHNHARIKKPPTEDEARAFLKEYAPFILTEFEKIMKADDEERSQWLLRDISRFMDEHSELKAFDPKVSALFIEVHRLEHEFHVALDEKLEAGVKPEAVADAVQGKLKVLVDKRLDLRQGQIAFQKFKLDREVKRIEDSKLKVDEITAAELKGIISDIKQAQQQAAPNKAEEPK